MPARVIVHAGFHKCGSTTIQRFLRHNRPHLSPRVQLLLPFRLGKGPARLAARYARFRTAQLLDEFERDMAEILAGVDPTRDLILSHENLAGRMPGRDGQAGYDSCADLMGRLAGVLRTHFQNDADIRFCFLTRSADDWLRSLWLHNLRVSRLTLDFDHFRETVSLPESLPETLENTARAVAPAQLVTAPLEQQSAARFGPAQLLIDQLDLPADRLGRLTLEPAHNIGPPRSLAPALLALNQSDLDHDSLIAHKTALLQSSDSESPAHVR